MPQVVVPLVAGGRPLDYWVGEGKIMIHTDFDGFDFHITADPDHSPSEMQAVLIDAARAGLSLIEEHDPELMEDGRIKIYLAPIWMDESEFSPGNYLEVVA
ncbi:hypothetical protein SEA_GOBY_30 [Streptomyces phage Goby]|uniref:Uncharacterized protein n=1 Tax=Streptomyces phage Goby TaxID=2182319 RepID=A0A2U8UTV9_9CAUD|nr:hypothetical protein KGH00_gp30 [Streptomyces phage Goby]AWN07549.1 hypothetical protein SEA_GOBY_30 [Streptomyces phage Goby]